MLKMQAFSLFCISILIVFSCKKEVNQHPFIKHMVPIKITKYESDHFIYEWNFEYNSENKLIKSDYDFGNYDIYTYDSEGKLERIESYIEESICNVFTYEYNNINQIVKNNTYSPDGILKYYFINEYNTVGNLIKRTFCLADGSLLSIYNFEYDSNNNMISKKVFGIDNEGELDPAKYDEWIYTYDKNNNIYMFAEFRIVGCSYINNPINITEISYPDTTIQSDRDYSYCYNNENFPIEYTVDSERYVIEYIEM
jgi:hypothetical protein